MVIIQMLFPFLLLISTNRAVLANTKDNESTTTTPSKKTTKTTATEFVVRNTSYGPVRGFVQKAPGMEAEVFLRIPYAKPPVGERRFEAPEEPDSWIHPLDCTQRPPWCVQFWYANDKLKSRKSSEDCLYLNIFTPKSHSTLRPPYPILVWIHGGSYQLNGANLFPTYGIVKNLVAHGLVVVTFNYRLGPLGFLSTLNDELPGNYGLEDQLMVLHWLQTNAHHFNGDPKQVTIGGESAGAASSSLLSVSPRGKGLFHRAMLRSGSSLSPWAVRSSSTDLNSMLFIKWANCGGEDINDMKRVKRCLQTVSVERLVEMWGIIGTQDLLYIVKAKREQPQNYNHPFLAHTYFTPVVDSFRGPNATIIPTYPAQLIEENAHVPVMIGVTSAECAAYVAWLYFLTKQEKVSVDVRDLAFVVPDTSYANPHQIKQAVEHHYIWHDYSNTNFNYAKALVKIASDQNFVAPATLEADLYAKAGVSVHTYVYAHSQPILTEKFDKYGIYDIGSAHGFDMVFLFQNTSVLDASSKEVNWTRSDLYVTDLLAWSISNFVTYGDPEVKDFPSTWPRYTEDCGRAFKISPSPELVNFFPEVRSFWRETIPIIEGLTLHAGYRFNPPMECVEDCSVDYKFGFFILLSLLLLLIVGVCTSLCAWKWLGGGGSGGGGGGDGWARRHRFGVGIGGGGRYNFHNNNNNNSSSRRSGGMTTTTTNSHQMSQSKEPMILPSSSSSTTTKSLVVTDVPPSTGPGPAPTSSSSSDGPASQQQQQQHQTDDHDEVGMRDSPPTSLFNNSNNGGITKSKLLFGGGSGGGGKTTAAIDGTESARSEITFIKQKKSLSSSPPAPMMVTSMDDHWKANSTSLSISNPASMSSNPVVEISLDEKM